MYDLFKQCLGESILLQRSNELWSAKRKSLSAAFYRDKLTKMMDIIRNCVCSYAIFMEKEYLATKKEFNISTTVNDL
jgi:cytochrome P450